MAKNNILFLLFFASLIKPKAQTYEASGSYFRCRYNNYSGYPSQESNFQNGYGISLKRYNFKDSVNPVLRNMELAATYYTGNCYYEQPTHFGSNWVKLQTQKALVSMGFYPVNIRLFQKNTHISIGGIFGAFVYRNTIGERSVLSVKDTFVPPYGWVTSVIRHNTYFNGKTKDDRKFIFGIAATIDQIIYKGKKGIWKMGAFVRYYLTPEYAYMAYLHPRQYGLQISWMFK